MIKIIILLIGALLSISTLCGQVATPWKLKGNLTDSSHFLGTTNNASLVMKANNQPVMWLFKEGTAGIGDSIVRTGYKLSVRGSVLTQRLIVKLYSAWPDYVFYDDYSLMPLPKLEDYYRRYGHLPGVPSSAEIEEDGLNIGSLQAVLLRKIEEMTLYIVEKKRKLDELKKRLERIERKNSRSAELP